MNLNLMMFIQEMILKNKIKDNITKNENKIKANT